MVDIVIATADRAICYVACTLKLGFSSVHLVSHWLANQDKQIYCTCCETYKSYQILARYFTKMN